MPSYADFFGACYQQPRANEREPFPYQSALAADAEAGQWPDLLDVPTGLGKTAAVVIAWLWGRLVAPTKTPKRLVYCLPMRVLTQQVAQSVRDWIEGARDAFGDAPLPSVHVLMGGDVDNAWIDRPEQPAVLIGTQDQLISRALNRGYTASRAAWPRHFGLLHDDALWVFDETQLMGVAVETSAQLQGLRERLGTWHPTRSLWMSATLDPDQLSTVDHPKTPADLRRFTLSPDDLARADVQARRTAPKALSQLDGVPSLSTKLDPAAAKKLAKAVLQHHTPGTRTLVILNRVAAAQALYLAICQAQDKPQSVELIHSRFRPCDRRGAEQRALRADAGDQVIIATQAVEAGVDISAKTLITALAPWPSLVQRFGRCNRYGEHPDARALWLDVKDDAKAAKPYDADALTTARALLQSLTSASPHVLAAVPYTPPSQVRPVLRRRDLLELFDTSADLQGDDLDIARFVRDSQHSDVHILWGDLQGDPSQPPHDLRADRDTLCAVSIGSFRRFLESLEAERKKHPSDSTQAKTLHAWAWQPHMAAKRGSAFQSQWVALSTKGGLSPRPGMVVFLSRLAGGYTDDLGWTGDLSHTPAALSAPPSTAPTIQDDAIDADPDTARSGAWVTLTDHLQHVEDATRALAAACALPSDTQAALCAAARWHDVGKAHPAFQRMLTDPLKDDSTISPPPAGALGPWAKSSHTQGHCERRHFRHELASALAWLAAHDGTPGADLTAFLIACHHGKVRLSLRSLPDEPPNRAYGVEDGEPLPAVTLPDGTVTPTQPHALSALMSLGAGSWAERTLGLRDAPDLGPFRLAFLEAVIRAADGRATADEAAHAKQAAQQTTTQAKPPQQSKQGATR